MISEESMEYFLSGRLLRSDHAFHCQTRDELQARLPRFLTEIKNLGLDQDAALKLLMILGELGNNSFDHNLGKWADLTGCLVVFHLDGSTVVLEIADRGQGIVNSLKRVLRADSPADILAAAFEQRISGRSPEQRGNGLKLVKSLVEGKPGAELVCFSSGEIYVIGETKTELLNTKRLKHASVGTLIVVSWPIS